MILGSPQKGKINYKLYGKVGKVTEMKMINGIEYACITTGKKRIQVPTEYLQVI